MMKSTFLVAFVVTAFLLVTLSGRKIPNARHVQDSPERTLKTGGKTSLARFFERAMIPMQDATEYCPCYFCACGWGVADPDCDCNASLPDEEGSGSS